MSGTVRSGRCRRRRGRSESGPAVAAVDPDRRQPELLAGNVVVEEALGGVEDALAGDVDRRERELERACAGL